MNFILRHSLSVAVMLAVISVAMIFAQSPTPEPKPVLKPRTLSTQQIKTKKLSPKQEWAKPTADESREALIIELKISPASEEDAYRYFVKAQDLAKVGKFPEALEAIVEAEKLEPKRLVIQLVKGAILANLSRTDEAVSAFYKAVALDSKSAQAHGFLCRALADTGKRSEAIDECKEAIRLEPGNTRFASFLAGLYISQERISEALQLLELAYGRDKNDLVVTGTLADLHLDDGSYAKAIELYEQIASKWPQVAIVYGRLSVVYGYVGRLSDAVSAARKFTELEPKSAVAQMNLGYTLQNAGFFDESIPPLLQATSLDRANGEAYLMLSESYDVIGDKSGRVSSLGHAYQYLPPTFEIAYSYGRALENAGRLREAVEPFERALRLSPDDVDGMAKLGSAYAEVYRYDEAIALLTKALSLRPTDQFIPMTLDVSKGRKYAAENFETIRKKAEDNPKSCQAKGDLAQSYRFNGKLKEAEREYLSLVACLPNNFEVYNAVSVFYNETGQMEKSNIYLQKAIELNPHHVLYSVLAVNLSDAGKLDDAIAATRRSVEIKPDFIYGYVLHGDLLMKKGSRNEALSEYQRAFELNPSGLSTNFKLAWFYIRAGDREGAFRHYNILRALAPSQLKYLERSLRAHFPTVR